MPDYNVLEGAERFPGDGLLVSPGWGVPLIQYLVSISGPFVIPGRGSYHFGRRFFSKDGSFVQPKKGFPLIQQAFSSGDGSFVSPVLVSISVFHPGVVRLYPMLGFSIVSIGVFLLRWSVCVPWLFFR